MAWIAGVDGCKGGWIAVYASLESGEIRDLECRVEKEFAKVMACPAPLKVVAVDMPIGLRDDDERRECDIEARSVLKDRRSSIFPAPAEGVIELFRKLGQEKWKEPSAYNCAKKIKGLSKQSFNLVPKISEVARYLEGHPREGRRIHEAHPEVCFAAMRSGKACSFDPMQHPKTTFGGLAERRALLRASFGARFEELEARTATSEIVGRVAPDDFYDAAACLWTAWRVYETEARALPGCRPVGSASLPMRIVY